MSIGRTSAFWLGTALAVVSGSVWLPLVSSPAAQAQADSKAKASRSEVHALGRVEPATGLIVVGSRPGRGFLKSKSALGTRSRKGNYSRFLKGAIKPRPNLHSPRPRRRRSKTNAQRARRSWRSNAQIDAAHTARLATATQIAEILKKKFDESTLLYKTLGGTLSGRDKLDADSKYIELQVQSLKAALDKSLLEVEQSGLAKQRALEDKQLEPSNPEFQLVDRQIELAKAGLAQTEVIAPRDGTILDVMAHAGEVGSGPLLRMGDLSAMVVVAEVYQTDVPRLTVGDDATVNILDRPINGKVTRIGSIVGRNQMMNIDPRSLQDLRVVDVTIALDEAEPASHLVNLEAEVAITPGGGG